MRERKEKKEIECSNKLSIRNSGMMKTKIEWIAIKLNEYTGRTRGKFFREGKSYTKQISRKTFLLFSYVFFFAKEDESFRFRYSSISVDSGRKHKIIIVHDSLYMTSEVCPVQCTWWQNMRKSESERFKAVYVGDFWDETSSLYTQGSKASQLLTMLNKKHKRWKGFRLPW